MSDVVSLFGKMNQQSESKQASGVRAASRTFPHVRERDPSAYEVRYAQVFIREINKVLAGRNWDRLMRHERSSINKAAHATAHAAARETTGMANLTGRPVQTKDEFKAEAEKLKAQRKADRGEATKQKFERKAGVKDRRVEPRDVDDFLKQVEKMNCSVEKAKAWAEDVLSRNKDCGVNAFLRMAYEDGHDKGAFRK
jgi:hypothetical protein